MAEGKTSFVFYADWKELISELSDKDAGKLIKHILKYVNDENPEEPTGAVKMALIPIRSQLKRDLKKWEEAQGRFSKAGKASAEARKIKKSQLYVIRCYNELEDFLKIGVTEDSITRRFSTAGGENNGMPYKYLIVGQHFYSETEIQPSDLEKLILARFIKYIPKIYFGGHTECIDISQLHDLIDFIKQRSTTFNNVELCSTKPTVNVTVNEYVDVTANVTVDENVTVKKNNTSPALAGMYEEFISFLNSSLGKNYKGDKKSRAAFTSRIKEGFLLEDIKTAIEHGRLTKFHAENNFNHLTPEFFTRPDKIEKFKNSKPITENGTITTKTFNRNPTEERNSGLDDLARKSEEFIRNAGSL